MKDISQMVYDRLAGDPSITGELAMYGDGPAIVNTEFPSDQEDGWSGRTQYPRISYRYDKRADHKRSTSGTLRIAVYVLSGMVDASERLENAIRARLKDVLMQPDDGPPFCVSWAQTDHFEVDRRSQLVILKEISFDVLEFPAQVTASPDPALSMNLFLKQFCPEAFLVSYDRTNGVYEPTDNHPAIYVKVSSIAPVEETYALITAYAYMDIHVLAPTAEGRLAWTRALFDELFKRGEIPTDDNHPMKLEVRAKNGADYLAEGQLSVRGRIMMLSARVRPEEVHPLNHPWFDGKDFGG